MKKIRYIKPKISYEPEADVLTWELSDKDIYSAKEMGNIVVHFTKNDLPILVEILDASNFLLQAKRLIHKEPRIVMRKRLALA
ncbi:MAG: DUF2283 domain-containing protein [Patescibacteria group bacterium]